MRAVRTTLFAIAVGMIPLAVIPLVASARAEDQPFPAGTSTHEMHGLQCTMVMPKDYDPAAEHSLVVILHGMGGTGTGMASSIAFTAANGFVVCAPKSRGQGWSAEDVGDVRTIVAELKKTLNVGASRLHGVGYSNGAWNLAAVALDDDLRFASATWIAGGYTGGKVPKHAKKGLGVLALAGAQDGNRASAEKTPHLLGDDVRMAEVRIQPNLGHEWPRDHIPYWHWWMGVQEGRYVPGETLAFDWVESREAGLAALGSDKNGAVEYWYSAEDARLEGAQHEQAKFLQNDLLQDRSVRFFGNQLTAWKLDSAEHAETFAALKIKSTPAIVTYDKKGKVKKVLTGKLKAKSVAAALRSVAATKKRPD